LDIGFFVPKEHAWVNFSTVGQGFSRMHVYHVLSTVHTQYMYMHVLVEVLMFVNVLNSSEPPATFSGFYLFRSLLKKF
jgi:hypothetical protein